MKLFTSKKVRRPRKPAFFIARLVVLSVTVAFASFTVTEYGLTLWDTDPRLAAFVMAVFGLSALVTPCLVPILTKARGAALAGLALVCVAFGAIDSVGLSMAFTGFEKRATEQAYQKAQDDLDALRSPILSRIDALQAKRDAIDVPAHEITSRQQAALATYTAQIASIDTELDRARTELDQYPASATRPDLFDNGLVAIIATLIQIALAIAFGAIEAVRTRLHAEAVKDYEERQEANRIERRKAKAVAKRRETMQAKTSHPVPRQVYP